MSRIVRIAITAGLTVAVSLLSGAAAASAQEMEHGRTPRAKVVSNQVQTQHQAALGAISYIRG